MEEKERRDRFFMQCVSSYSRPNILEVGKETCSPTKVEEYFADDKRYYLPLHYVYAGKGYITYRNKKVEVHAGDFFLVPPRGIYSLRSGGKRSVQLLLGNNDRAGSA